MTGIAGLLSLERTFIHIVRRPLHLHKLQTGSQMDAGYAMQVLDCAGEWAGY